MPDILHLLRANTQGLLSAQVFYKLVAKPLAA